jgi:Transmembrane amino acid transporter protein
MAIDSSANLLGTSTANHHHTYVPGEDVNRLQSIAESMGMERARNPMSNVRQAVALLLADSTLEAAWMHSVGALGEDEHVDQQGTLHLRTFTTRRKRRRGSTGGITSQYGSLENLFQQPMAQQGGDGGDEIEVESVDAVEGGSLTAAIFGIIKGTVGPAILYLPRGFSKAGWAVAIMSMILATSSYLYSALRLLECWKIEKTKLEKLEEIRALLVPRSASSESLTRFPRASVDLNTLNPHKSTYGELGRDAFNPTMLTYPELARRAFGRGALFVQMGIAAMQFGVCLTYFIFVPQNLVECIRSLTGVELNKVIFLILMVVIEIPLSWIRDIRKLTLTNILATFLITYGLLSCLIMAVAVTASDTDRSFVDRLSQLPPANNSWLLFVGTSVSAFDKGMSFVDHVIAFLM